MTSLQERRNKLMKNNAINDIMYRWTINTSAKTANFYDCDNETLRRDFVSYVIGIRELNLNEDKIKEMLQKKQVEYPSMHVYQLMDMIANEININMKAGGHVYENYDFEYEILHITKLNEQEVKSETFEAYKSGLIDKSRWEASCGIYSFEQLDCDACKKYLAGQISFENLCNDYRNSKHFKVYEKAIKELKW